jgi:MFS family permease
MSSTSTTALPDEARSSLERRVVVSAALAHGATHSLELVFAALLVRIGAEFGADFAVLGAVGNAGTITFGAFALPSGWLVDRRGPRWVMTLALGSAAVFALIVAVSPNLVVLAISLSLLGAGIGLYHPAGTSLVATVATRRGLALASHGVAGNLGIALAPALAIGVSIAFDWRVAYLVFATLAAGVSFLVWRLAPNRDEVAQAVAERQAAHRAAPPIYRRSTPPTDRNWFSTPLLVIFAAAIGTGFIYRGSLTFFATHLEQQLGIELFGWDAEAIAGTFATVVLLAAVFGQFTGGWLSDRVSAERAIVPFTLLIPLFLFLMSISVGVALLLAGAGFVVANFAQQPVVNSLITDYAPEGAVGRAFGLSFTLTFGVGSLASSVAGVITERYDTSATFLALSLVGVLVSIAMVSVLFGAERRRDLMRPAGASAGGD